jgi:hypothetical protein
VIGYVYTGYKSNYSLANNLSLQAEILGSLLGLTVEVIGGEPVTLVNAAFQ